MNKKTNALPILGWKEWAALPELNVPRIHCKVDTGARTSALHTFYLEEFREAGKHMVRFGLHPRRQGKEEVHCIAEICDTRNVTDSGGHTESRFVIRTPVVIGNEKRIIEITLTNRETMQFRMLLGRTAIRDYYLVDSGSADLMGNPSKDPSAQPFVNRRHDEEE